MPDAAATSDGGRAELDLVLDHVEPIDTAGVFAWMAARALPGVETATSSSFARAIRLPGGPAWFSLSLEEPGRLRLTGRASSPGDVPALTAIARRLFDLDADSAVVDGALARHPALALRVAAIPGIRVPGAADPHEMLIRAMVGQQITVAAARTALTALADALGERVEGFDGVDRLFPTMAAIAEHGHDVLRGPAARIRAVTGAAAALADGSLELTHMGASRAALLAMPGIGPWTADYVRMRVLGDADITLPGDVAVRSGAAVLGIPSDPKGFAEWAARAAPWRSYLTAHLWRASADARPRGSGSRGAPADKDTAEPSLSPGASAPRRP